MASATQSTSECVTRMGSMVNGPIVNFDLRSNLDQLGLIEQLMLFELVFYIGQRELGAYTGTFSSLRIHGRPPMWSSWPCVSTMARTCCLFSIR
jgi:hypothetical protein